MYYVQSALLVLLLMSVSTAVPAAEAESLPGLCDSCHGSLGVSSDSDVPTIAGQAAAYISATLELYQDWGRPCLKSAFRHGDTSRPETTMCKVSEGLAPADIETLSQHYQAQTFVSAQQDFDAAKAETGGDLHEIHCETCHPMGGSMAGRGPRLAGQWVPYLRMAMSQALSGEHLVPPVMEERLTDFSVDDIDALLNFYASQQN
jgi:sulfide dehydrogenase cytochrome subunit